MAPSRRLIAVDIGNSRIKLGWFDGRRSEPFPEPALTLDQPPEWNPRQVAEWLPGEAAGAPWLIASVAPRTCAALLASLTALAMQPESVRMLTHGDVPLAVAVPQPSQVGLDRLLGLVAAQALKRPAAGAIVVDLGTAITINRLSPGGAFEGGAILPGLRLAARSLATGTQQLPEAPTLAEVPAPLGVDTLSAMQSGIFWGAVGAIGEIVHRLAASAEYDLFLTGGGAALLAATLPSATQLSFKLIPHLTLSGIAICARRP